MKKVKGLLWGVAIIAIGVIWGINESGIADINIFFDGWWTLFIIIPSLIGLFTDRDKTGSIIGLAIGGLLLASRYVDLSRYKGYIIPAVIILIGICVVVNAVSSKSADKVAEDKGFEHTVINGQPHTEGATQEYYSTFSGQDLVFNDDFVGGSFTATFGGMKIDLRNARIADNAVINANATFGGIDILVPPNVNVIVKSNSLFGGVSDKTSKMLPPEVTNLYINSRNMFGGTDIK